MEHIIEQKRIFKPKKTEDLNEKCLSYIDKEVTVLSWHENIFTDEYPDSKKVGFINEFMLDIPEEELII